MTKQPPDRIMGGTGTDECPVCKGVMRNGICQKDCKIINYKSD